MRVESRARIGRARIVVAFLVVTIVLASCASADTDHSLGTRSETQVVEEGGASKLPGEVPPLIVDFFEREVSDNVHFEASVDGLWCPTAIDGSERAVDKLVDADDILTWVELSSVPPLRLDAGGVLADLSTATGGEVGEVFVPAWFPEFLRLNQGLIKRAWLAVRGATAGGIVIVDAPSSTRDLVYVDFCDEMERGRELLDEYARAGGPEPDALLGQLVSNVDSGDAVGGLQLFYDAATAPVPWSAIPPDIRLLDEETMPKDVLSSLSEVLIRIEIPEAWRTEEAGAVVCTRVELGWNECANLDNPDEYNVTGGGLDMLAWVASEGPTSVEIYLVNDRADVADDKVFVGVTVVDPDDADDRGVVAGVRIDAGDAELPGQALDGSARSLPRLVVEPN